MAFRRHASPLLLGPAACDILFDMTFPTRLSYVLSALATSSLILWYVLSVSSDHSSPPKAILYSAILVWPFIFPRGLRSLASAFGSVVTAFVVVLAPAARVDTFGLSLVFSVLVFLGLCTPGILLAHGVRQVLARDNVSTGILAGTLITIPSLAYAVWVLSWGWGS